MSETYTGVDPVTLPDTTFTIPADGDDVDAVSVNAFFQQAADNWAHAVRAYPDLEEGGTYNWTAPLSIFNPVQWNTVQTFVADPTGGSNTTAIRANGSGTSPAINAIGGASALFAGIYEASQSGGGAGFLGLGDGTGTGLKGIAGTFIVSGCVSGTGGVVRLYLNSSTGITTSSFVTCSGVGGVSAATVEGNAVSAVGSAGPGPYIELAGTSFSGAYTSGGTVYVEGTPAIIAQTGPIYVPKLPPSPATPVPRYEVFGNNVAASWGAVTCDGAGSVVVEAELGINVLSASLTDIISGPHYLGIQVNFATSLSAAYIVLLTPVLVPTVGIVVPTVPPVTHGSSGFVINAIWMSGGSSGQSVEFESTAITIPFAIFAN